MTQHEFYVQSLIIWTALSIAVGAGVVLYLRLRRAELPKRKPGAAIQYFCVYCMSPDHAGARCPTKILPSLARKNINGERLNDQEWADWLLARDAFHLPAAVRADDTVPPPGAHDGGSA